MYHILRFLVFIIYFIVAKRHLHVPNVQIDQRDRNVHRCTNKYSLTLFFQAHWNEFNEKCISKSTFSGRGKPGIWPTSQSFWIPVINRCIEERVPVIIWRWYRNNLISVFLPSVQFLVEDRKLSYWLWHKDVVTFIAYIVYIASKH